MGEAFGLGDGSNDLSGTSGLAESRPAEAGRQERQVADRGRWPGPGTVLRVVGLCFLALVVGGWLLTVLNA